MKTKQTKETKLRSTFTRQLATYSATATAVLLVAPAAQGTIQKISSATLTLTPTDSSLSFRSVTLGVFHGVLEGRHGTSFYRSAGSYRRGGTVALKGHFLQDFPGNLYKLAPGAHIVGGSFHLVAMTGRLATRHTSFVSGSGPSRYHAGAFQPATNQNVTGYVGFKTQHNSQNYYGWLRVQVHADAHDQPDKLSILTDGNGYVGAYGLAGDDITAGQLTATPEPGTMAIGARGVRELRRRRANAAVSGPINSSK